MWRYGQSGTEPTLDEVIHEPVIRLMMERDHVTEEVLLCIINIARQHLDGWADGSRQGRARGPVHVRERKGDRLTL
jgi:hypothetical protein